MKKRIIAMLAAVTMLIPASAMAEGTKTPKIIVDERELVFTDQSPVIVEETGRTLIPLRFVLESAGAKVRWNGETRTVTVDSGDNRNRVVLTIDSDEMKMYYYPTVKDSVSDVQKLDQVPVIMNDRTMIPVRAVLEAIGATVEWDEENYVINVTSRAYTRYLRDMGLEGYEVNYPLSNGTATFDPPRIRESEVAYDAKNELPALSISAENTKAAVGETIDVYVNLANTDTIEEGAFLSTIAMTFKYDSEKLSYAGYALLNPDGSEFSAVMDASNPSYNNDSVKVVSIVDLGMDEIKDPVDGAIAKVSFEVVAEGETELSLSSRMNSTFGADTVVSFTKDNVHTTHDDANEIYIDSTPIVINAAE